MNEIERKLGHIREQATKGQYLNALACSNELQTLLLRGLNAALKREPDPFAGGPHQEPPPDKPAPAEQPKCGACGGTGHTPRAGFLLVLDDCRACNGTGRTAAWQ